MKRQRLIRAIALLVDMALAIRSKRKKDKHNHLNGWFFYT